MPLSTKRRRLAPDTRTLSAVELGKLAKVNATYIARIGWHRFFRSIRHRNCLHPNFTRWKHHRPNPQLLQIIKSGAPCVTSSSPWSLLHKDHCVHRGSHPSARIVFADFLQDEMLDMVNRKYWTVVPYRAVRHLPQLKISPAGVIPQRNRRPRTIIDYTFSGVTASTFQLAPPHAMQFGKALPRILQRIAYANPRFGPVHLIKVDLSDGYYRIPITPSGALNLAVTLPSSRRAPLLAIPTVLTMGWIDSAPYFCMATESIADFTNLQPASECPSRPHFQEPLANAADDFQTNVLIRPRVPLSSVNPHPLSYTDVYMDDYTALAQTRPIAINLRRRLMYNINDIFRCNTAGDTLDSPPRREPISEKKLLQGDASWSTAGIVLGWLLDTVKGTLQLPSHRVDRLSLILHDALATTSVSCKQWHRLLGELRSMLFAIPGSEGLFSPLQLALQRGGPTGTVTICPSTRRCLQEWMLLANSLAYRPTAITDLVPCPPHYMGACDASRDGMGGVWLPTSLTHESTPFVWRYQFPPAVRNALVSFDNPTGSINNSELELAASILHEATLLSAPPIDRPVTCLFGSDNTPTVAWLQRASLTTDGPAATLLHLRSRLRRAHQLNATPCAVPGVDNVLADFASRSFHLSDTDFLRHFHSNYPIQTLWQPLRPPPDLCSFVISTLLRRTPLRELLLPEHDPLLACGKSGVISAAPSTPIHSSNVRPTRSRCYRSSPFAIAGAKYLPAALLQKSDRWRKPFVPLARRWPQWDCLTPASPSSAPTLTSASNAN